MINNSETLSDKIRSIFYTTSFISFCVLSTTAIYMNIRNYTPLFFLNFKYNSIVITKIAKPIISILTTYEIKKTISRYSYSNYRLIFIFLLNILNTCLVVKSHEIYNIISSDNILVGIINTLAITMIVFIIEVISDNKYMNYFIDGKILTISYLLSNFIPILIFKLIFNILLSLKLICIYNATHFIIKNNIKNNFIYIFLIYMNIINRYIDINAMDILT